MLFSTLLLRINLLVIVSSVLSFALQGGNKYVNLGTVGWGVALAIQTHLLLQNKPMQRDPFKTLIAISMIGFYSFRILTLTLIPYSSVFDRFSFGPESLNDAIFFIILANCFLYAGLYCVGGDAGQPIRMGNWKAVPSLKPILLFTASIVFTYSKAHYWNVETIPRGAMFLVLFMLSEIVMKAILVYLLIYWTSLELRHRIGLVFLLLIETAAHTLGGSRGAVYTLGLQLLVVSLAILGTLDIPKRLVRWMPALFAIVAGFAFVTFNVGNHVRNNSPTGYVQAIELAHDSLLNQHQSTPDPNLLRHVFNRLGFLDMSAEIIANHDRYDSVISFSSYGKSIVDNLLTPGFDIFNQPRISHSMKFVYADHGAPTKDMVEQDYQSDQLGIYGELFILFGAYLSLPVFFALGFLFKSIYVGLRGGDPFVHGMKRVVVLTLFVMTINSFGFDWIMIEILPVVVSIYLYRYFLPSRQI